MTLPDDTHHPLFIAALMLPPLIAIAIAVVAIVRIRRAGPSVTGISMAAIGIGISVFWIAALIVFFFVLKHGTVSGPI